MKHFEEPQLSVFIFEENIITGSLCASVYSPDETSPIESYCTDGFFD